MNDKITHEQKGDSEFKNTKNPSSNQSLTDKNKYSQNISQASTSSSHVNILDKQQHPFAEKEPIKNKASFKTNAK